MTGISPEICARWCAITATADGAALLLLDRRQYGHQRVARAYWLQEVINAVSGNLDRRGGSLVGQGIFDFARFGKKYGIMSRRNQSRIGGFTSVNDAFPGAILADEILTPGDDRSGRCS